MRPSSSVSAAAEELVAAIELDAYARRRPPARGVEDVGRDHGANLLAWARWCASDLLLVGAHEPAVADDLLAADVEPVDAVRRREDEARDGVGGAGELEPVGAPDGDVGALARLERADVVSAEHRGAAARAEPQRVPHGQRRRAAAPARDEQRLLDLEEQVAALVRRRAVDAEPDAHAGVEQVAHRCDAGAEPQVRRRAVRDAGAASPRSARRRAAERWTQCAHHTSPSSQPSESRYSTGEQP